MRPRILGIIAIGMVMAPHSAIFAAIKASDSASDLSYSAEQDGAWKGTYEGEPPNSQNPPGNDNGGTGFLPWSFNGGHHVPGVSPYGTTNHFIDGVDFPASAFNNLGSPAFGLTTAHQPYDGTTAVARRPFAQPLAVGDTFSADFDSPAVYDDITGFSYPFAIIVFNDATGADTFAIEAGSSDVFGDFNWRYRDADSTNVDVGNIAPTATSDGSSIALKMTGATGGQVTFDGVVFDVTFIGGAPTAVTFILFDNSSGNGLDPENGDLLDQPNGEREFFFDNLKIEAGGPAAPGDFNNDGSVNGADLTEWKGDFGPGNGSDADGDNDSDGMDFLIWQRNVNAGATANAAAVPEPASFMLWLVAAAAINAATRRARRRWA